MNKILYDRLENLCQGWADDFIKNEGYTDEATEQIIFEVAMKLTLGEDIFIELTKQIMEKRKTVGDIDKAELGILKTSLDNYIKDLELRRTSDIESISIAGIIDDLKYFSSTIQKGEN